MTAHTPTNSTAYPIPKDALEDRLAFIGNSGSGKTYAAGTAVERLLDANARLAVIDPLGVWWGLRSKADGKGDGYPVVIFGGAHGDLPLTEQSGALIGDAVASMAESAVVTLSDLGSKASERRFMLAFLESVYRAPNGEPLHLIFDEADLWAPQRSPEPQLQARMENIVRRGRFKGLVPWLITQRPAVISKDVLSQVDGLVAMKLTSSHDRAALGAWIEGQADRADEKRMLARMPQLPRGTGIVWIPGRGVLEEAAFPAKRTFDSSATPKRGEVKRTANLKPLDLGKLKAQIAALESDRAEGKGGKGKGAALTGTQVQTTGEAELRAFGAAEHQRGYAEGFEAGRSQGFQQGIAHAQSAIAALDAPITGVTTITSLVAAKTHAPVEHHPRPAPPPRPPRPSGAGLPSNAQSLLDEAQARFPARFTWGQLAALTGRKARGGSFNSARKLLLEGGHVREVSGMVVPAIAEKREPMTDADLLELWISALPSPANELLATIAAHRRGISVAGLAEATGRQPRGGSWNSGISMLRTNGLIVEKERGVFSLGALSQANGGQP